jgi:hypothetical protein
MSNLKTVSFDPAVYRLVPVKLYPEMRQAMQTVNNSLEDKEYAAIHEEMLLSLPAALPGVVEHSGDAVGYGNSKEIAESNDTMRTVCSYKTGFCDVPLFTHPPAQPDTELMARIAELERKNVIEEAKSRHWKANHDNMVTKAAFLSQRPDLPVDRIPAYQELIQLRALIAQLTPIALGYTQLAAQAGQEPVRYKSLYAAATCTYCGLSQNDVKRDDVAGDAA